MNAKVIPFPTRGDQSSTPPPSAQAPRVILQASSHPRGGRPYTFAGVIDEYHAPGVVFRNGDTRSAADAAWLVSAVLGSPRRVLDWPGVPGARERAEAYGLAWTTPDGKKLRSYQRDGAAFLAERDYGLLYDTMGIGKSPQSLAAAEARLSLGVVPSPTTPAVLVVCPALAKRHWQREILRWTGHKSTILDGLRPEEFEPTRYVIANYDILHGAQRRDAAGVVFNREDLPGWAPTLRDLQFPIVVFDEAHILRGRSSRRTAACRELCLRTPVVWGLTGTPMPNYVRDLWSILDVLTGGLFGKYYSFARTHCDGHDGQYGFEDKGHSRLDELRGRLSFFALGRTKDSVGLELPPMQREVYKIDVEVSAPTVHEGHRALDKGAAVASAFRATARAKRSVVIAQAVEALEAHQKVVVFLYMREQCDAVARAIKDKWDGLVVPVHGEMSPEGRDRAAQTFREASGPTCFVATVDSVGIAISLVGADLVLFGDLVAEPWKLLQAEKRCHRFDSKNSVLVRYLIATGTIDEGLAEAVIEKLAVLDETLGGQIENADLSKALGARSNEEIVETLFSRLRAWSGGGDGE